MNRRLSSFHTINKLNHTDRAELKVEFRFWHISDIRPVDD